MYSVKNTGVMGVKQFKSKEIKEKEKNYEFSEVNKRLIQDLKHVRFYLTLILKDLIKENNVDKIAKKYGVTKGAIQTLKKRATFFPNIVCNI